MDKPDPPPAPDPAKMIAAQSKANRQAAIQQYGLQATNQRTPYGSMTYDQVGTWADGTPRYEVTQSLSPEQQRLYDQSVDLGSGFMGLGGEYLDQIRGRDPFSVSGAPEAADPSQLTSPELRTGYASDFSEDRQRVEDALMGRLNEDLEQDRASLEQRLANQGVAVGSEAWQNAMQDYTRAQQEARTSAILGAGQEQSRLANLARDEASFENRALQQEFANQFPVYEATNEARDRDIRERLLERNQPMNELGATSGLFGLGTRGASYANTPAPGVAPTDVMGAEQMAYQGKLNNYNAKMQNRNAMMSGLFGLGGAALGGPLGSWIGSKIGGGGDSPTGYGPHAGPTFGVSDRRLKRDITPLGEYRGYPVYAFRFAGQRGVRVGVMADEVRRIMPEAVREVAGYDVVDYGAIGMADLVALNLDEEDAWRSIAVH